MGGVARVWRGQGLVPSAGAAARGPRLARAGSRAGLVRSCRGARGSCASWHVGEPRAVCHPQQSFKESSTRNIILIVLLNRPRKISGSAGPFSRVSHLLVEVSVLFIYLFASVSAAARGFVLSTVVCDPCPERFTL